MNNIIRKSILPFYKCMSGLGQIGVWFTVPLSYPEKRKLRFYSRRRLIDRNYDENIKKFELHRPVVIASGGYIENQKDYTDLYYGAETLDFCGCEVIAVYNALHAMEINESGSPGEPSLPKLISIFEQKGITMAGEFGTSPLAVRDFFIRRGFDVQMVRNESRYGLVMRHCSIGILTVFNDRDRLHAGIHTMCITKDAVDGLVLHNTNGTFRTYATMKELIEDIGSNKKAQGIMILGVQAGKSEHSYTVMWQS